MIPNARRLWLVLFMPVLVVDFESGAYLRNTHDREKAVREQAAMASKCPRCVEAFGQDALSTLGGFAKVVDESRAWATRNILCDPAREVYPGLHIGNFYAWPINRLPRPEGRRPVRLTFGPKGRNHWVFPDGKVRAADWKEGHID